VSEAAALEAPRAGGAAPLRVLVLHGRLQSAALLHGRLAPLQRRLAGTAELVFTDAPCCVPGGETREWWPGDSCGGGVEAAVACAAAAWASHGPFDALLGFSQGAAVAYLCCARGGAAFAGLRGVVLASGYAPEPGDAGGDEAGRLLALPSLHLLSEDDASVPAAASRRLAQRFASPALHVHTAGHCVPQRAADLQAVVAFLERLRAPEAAPGGAADAPYELLEEVSDELSALSAIFGDEYELLRANPPRCRVAVAWREGGAPWLYAEFSLPRG
jgi:pimeloyl-ACP methyl ester carboxylesterase